jgi:EmrB/QacA subfamily drug resistance transporter
MDATTDRVGSGFAPSAPLRSLTHKQTRLICMSMMLPVFLGSIDQSILASALPTIGRDLGDVHNLPWLITAYLIAATAVTPLYGKFADIKGRRVALLIALGTYMVGCLISASSPNIYVLICGRIVQGFGGGGLTAIANMVLGDVAAPKDRGKYYMYFSAAFTTAGACGPALGGWIADHLPWNVIFLWNFPLSICAVVLALTVLRRLPRHERAHRLDFVGAFLVMIASSTFMLALNLGGVRYSWLSPPILALFACALFLGVGFVVRLMTAVEPLIPIAILADPAARFAIFTHAFGWGPIVGLNIFLPMYLQSALGWSPTDAGLSLIVLMVTLNTSAGLSSQLLGRVERYKLLPLSFMLIAIGSIVTLGLTAAHMTPLRFELLMFLIGLGFGPVAPLTMVALQNTVSQHHFGSAVGTMNFNRNLFGTMLVAAFGAIVLGGVPLTSTTPGSLHALRTLGGVSATTFSYVFFAAAGTMAIAFLTLLLLEEKPLQTDVTEPEH